MWTPCYKQQLVVLLSLNCDTPIGIVESTRDHRVYGATKCVPFYAARDSVSRARTHLFKTRRGCDEIGIFSNPTSTLPVRYFSAPFRQYHCTCKRSSIGKRVFRSWRLVTFAIPWTVNNPRRHEQAYECVYGNWLTKRIIPPAQSQTHGIGLSRIHIPIIL